MSGCICGRCCGENRTDPDCPECNPKVLAPKTNFKGAREGMVRDMERNVTPTIISSYTIKDGIDVDNVGHGHVWPRADGNRMRCGGSGLCRQCKADNVRKNMTNPTTEVTYEQLREKLNQAVSLLYKSAQQFRYYEKNHREKMTDPTITRGKLLETFEKAEANAAIAKEIEDQINEFQNRPKTETPRD